MFGASAAAGCLANLNGQQMRRLLDYAAPTSCRGCRLATRHRSYRKAFVSAAASARGGVTAALKRHPFKTVELQSVVVHVATHEASIVNNRDILDICLQHMVAVMLVDRTVTFASAHEKERMPTLFVLGVGAKVQLVPDEVLDRRLPRREALVEITGQRWHAA